MQQKTNWTRFLIIGINILVGILSISCDKGEVEYRAIADYYFTNKASVPMRIKTFDKIQNGYRLLEDYKIKINETLLISFDILGGGINPDELGSIITSDSTVVIYDQVKCESFRKTDMRGINDMNNYKITQLDNNYYKLEYTFTEEQLLNAEDCN